METEASHEGTWADSRARRSKRLDLIPSIAMSSRSSDSIREGSRTARPTTMFSRRSTSRFSPRQWLNDGHSLPSSDAPRIREAAASKCFEPRMRSVRPFIALLYSMPVAVIATLLLCRNGDLRAGGSVSEAPAEGARARQTLSSIRSSEVHASNADLNDLTCEGSDVISR